jgi:hypothetical protein
VRVEHNAQAPRPLAHPFERAAAVAQQVDQGHALGVEQLEGEPHPLGRVLDPGEGVGDVGQQVLAPAQSSPRSASPPPARCLARPLPRSPCCQPTGAS